MRRYVGLLLILLLLVSSWPVQAEKLDREKYPYADLIRRGPFRELQIDGRSYLEQARRLLAGVNELRAERGVAPLVLDARLEEAALLRAAETSIYWSHMRPDGSFIFEQEPFDAENIAAGNSDPEKVLAQWRHSPSHYEAMVNPAYRSIGIAAFGTGLGEAPRWWAQVFSVSEAAVPLAETVDGEVYRPELRVNADLLQVELRPLEDRFWSWGNGLRDAYTFRQEPGQHGQLILLAHYKIDDGYVEPTLLPLSGLRLLSSDGTKLRMAGDRDFSLLDEGEAEIVAQSAETGEEICRLKMDIVPTCTLGLRGQYKAAESEALLTACREQAATAEPAVQTLLQDEEGRWQSAADLAAEGIPRSLNWDSRLERYGLRMMRLFSLGMLTEGPAAYPDQRAVEGLLDISKHQAWHCFSDQDRPSDQAIDVPVWAQSMAAVVLQTGRAKLTFICYSDQQGDELKLADHALQEQFMADPSSWRQETTLPETELLSFETLRQDQSLSYQASLFEDCLQGRLSLPQEERRDWNLGQRGEAELKLNPYWRWSQSGVHPEADLDPQGLTVTSTNVESAAAGPGLSLLFKQAGELTLRLSLRDAETERILKTKDFALRVLEDQTAEKPDEPPVSPSRKSEQAPSKKTSWHYSFLLLPLLLLLIGAVLCLYFLHRPDRR